MVYAQGVGCVTASGVDVAEAVLSQIRPKATEREVWHENADPPEYKMRIPAVPFSRGYPAPTIPSLYTGDAPMDKHSPIIVE